MLRKLVIYIWEPKLKSLPDLYQTQKSIPGQLKIEMLETTCTRRRKNNAEGYLYNFLVSKYFLNGTPKNMNYNEKIDTFYCIKNIYRNLNI